MGSTEKEVGVDIEALHSLHPVDKGFEKPPLLAQMNESSRYEDPPNPKGEFLKWYARMFVLHLSPAWFAMTMGTGVTSLLLETLPYKFHGLDVIAIVFFGITLFSFGMLTVLSIIRFIVWPQVLWLLLLHSTHSEFLGCTSMTISTLMNFCALHWVHGREGSFRYFVWAVWWFNSAYAIILCFGLTFLKATRHKHSLNAMTGIWLIPIIALTVVGSSGSIMSEMLPVQYAKITIVTSYMMIGCAWCLIFISLTLYYARLVFYKVPPANLIVTVFVPLGPCAQACFGYLRLSSAVFDIYKEFGQSLFGTGLLSAEEARYMNLGIQGCSILAALCLWGLCFFWFTIALSLWLDTWVATKLNFNPGWWGACFPVGVYALATIEMGRAFESGAFKILGVVITFADILVWLLMMTLSFWDILHGKVYVHEKTHKASFYEPYLGHVTHPPKHAELKRQFEYTPRKKIPRIWRITHMFTWD